MVRHYQRQDIGNYANLCICQHWLLFDTIPLLKAYYENLLARGKVKMVAVIAVMRKLLVICYGVLKSGQVFDVDYVKKSKPCGLLDDLSSLPVL